MMNDIINNEVISWSKFFDMDSVHYTRSAYALPCNNCQYYELCSRYGINKNNFYDKFADRYKNF